jgi:multiple sugar transport system ATP-binding protein
LVRKPSIYLMDEPLSSLDAKLRADLRLELKRIQKEIGATILYVTHDQTEAMTMGTRIAVLRDGVVLQQDEPQVIFQRPANVFVARFIGSPPMNIVPCRIADTRTLEAYGREFSLPEDLADIVKRNDLVGREVLLGIRPERVGIGKPTVQTLSADVDGVEHLGSETLVSLLLGGSEGTATGAPPAEVIARLAGYEVVPSGPVGVDLDLAGANLFDPESELRFSGSAT